ncbi:hypothetical protein N7466_003349 [Penicillium verhagenii]|uniref:uncharacterized protein n=1 Tax=Penicillium verhagenii TaxID=1562060 RepID=UPI0025457A92|nr:uncharacterized protein N7466_003349 [Penicillium verhagenii]KAJ5936899.1 hypothetical protein N7466_003349 [Penicillium verhagenii]
MPNEAQAMDLATQFLKIQRLPYSWWSLPLETEPTREEVTTMLRPYRSDNLRKLANLIWSNRHGFPILLRTWYNGENNGGDDVCMRNWMNAGLHIDAFSPWAVINDSACFGLIQSHPDHPEDWRRVLALLPEVAGPDQCLVMKGDFMRFNYIQPWHMDRIRKFKEQLAFEKSCRPHEWDLDRVNFIETCAAGVQRAMAAMPIILCDKEAFRTGNPLLMYIDYYQQVIRQTRITLTEDLLNEVIIDWAMELVTPWIWENSQLGEHYKLNGRMGQILYQLDEKDLGPPERQGAAQ